MESRLKLLTGIFILFTTALLARLFYWQGLMAADLTEKARFQYNSGSALSASRGNILARDGTWLAASSQTWMLYASPKVMETDPRIVASTLAPITAPENADAKQIQEETSRLTELLNKKDLMWVALKRKISDQNKDRIQALEIHGLGFDKEEARAYPEGSSSAQLLGFVGKDDNGNDKGYFGLEGYYDLSLSGKDGFVERQSDALGAPIFFGKQKNIEAIGGLDLVTHIDKRVQLLVEEKLKEGIEKYGAKSGSAVVMNPKTGGIMAMASYPSYDPKTYFDFTNEVFKNPIVSDSFEPGSIFKPIIMAAGIDSGLINANTICDICSGPAKVANYSIETWDNKYYPNSTMTDVIIHSDNVGMVFIGNKLGPERLYDYLRNFGFGELTGIDLQGEANPPMREKGTWNIVDQATATFGQGIAVTPIQMVRAMSVIANKGIRVVPQVVDKVKSDGFEEDIDPQVEERVISEDASREMTEIMIKAVQYGEAKWAVPKGFTIAGKTGTAQIAVGGQYDDVKTNASFIGFAPVDDPQFVMLITLSEPQSSQWASETTAPLWFNIARHMFPYLGIQPQ